METLAQPQPHKGGSRTNSPDSAEHASRAGGSLDIQGAGRHVVSSTGHLAEAAFSNLRKSLAAQRPFTVVSPTAEGSTGTRSGRSSPLASSPSGGDRELRPVHKSTLEERLRASFAIGEASAATTPEGGSHAPSHAPSPKPAPQSNPPGPVPSLALSPTSTPLPDSPIISPNLDADNLSVPHLSLAPEVADVASTEPVHDTASSSPESTDVLDVDAAPPLTEEPVPTSSAPVAEDAPSIPQPDAVPSPVEPDVHDGLEESIEPGDAPSVPNTGKNYRGMNTNGN